MPIRKSILIIDDVEAERTLISSYLQQQGYRLYHAHDGLDGINKARLLVPDLVLMDADMPRCSGFDACKILTQDAATYSVPIIFVSAYADAAQRVQGLLAGAVDYISKPFDFDEVRLRVSVHLERRPAKAPVHATPPPDTPEPGVTSHLNSILFHSARVHLLSRLAEPPDMAELAHLTGTNSKRLNTAFRHYAGVTVFEYLREERMKEARQMLHSTEHSISDIATRLGFSSCANFSTAFRTRFGASPSRFRQRPANLVNPPLARTFTPT